MRQQISGTLRDILTDTRKEIESDKSRHNLADLKKMVRDAVPVRSFVDALSAGKALVAEIKERSPSQGNMRPENVREAPEAYRQSPVVKAISVLTSSTHFGETMRVEFLERMKKQIGKPVLRKDFIIEEYQVYQARAYGADAILLMANVVEPEEMRRLSDLAFELGMDVLFETHRAEELSDLPPKARVIGINCRNFEGGLSTSNFKVARFLRQKLGLKKDRSVDTTRFNYADKLPSSVIKIAESGVSSSNCREVLSLGFHAILVGTSLLMDDRGINAGLREFEKEILG